ncbi:MAG: hypothetical protein HFJ30_09435, partial [Clostridia bacterium]|nr:hypothetical protein [Clostridia bacterium]
FFDKIENTYDYIEEENKLAHDKIVMELKTGEVLNEMLEEFRKINN